MDWEASDLLALQKLSLRAAFANHMFNISYYVQIKISDKQLAKPGFEMLEIVARKAIRGEVGSPCPLRCYTSF